MTLCFFIGISLTSCEKDLYEDVIQESPKGTINYVKIEDVPFLIPSIEKFNKDYSFLSDPLKAKNTNKDGENLNLNLEQIIEYVQANGLKSYSIAIKKEFGINDDLYFENLTIYEKDGQYESLILKYNQNDDTENFDLETFSGTLELFDINYNDIAYIQYENGLKAHIKYETFGCLEYEFNMTTGVSTFWFNHCGDTIGSTQTDTNSSPGGGNSPSTGTSGPTGGTPSGGTTGPQGGTPGGGANNNNNGVIIIAPNPLEVYKDKRERNFIQALQNANQAGCFGSQSPDFKASTYQYLETTLIDDDGLTAQTETYPQEEIDFVIQFIKFKCDNPSITEFYSLNKIKELQDYLDENPFALLNIDCDQLPFWQNIAQHQVPQIVKNKIQNIDNQTGWFTSAGIQTLNDSNNGSAVNMDFFSITVSEMPIKPNGDTYTKVELFNYIRTHINDFFDDLTFTPVVDVDFNIDESSLWLSNNPLGTIINIDITGNNGSVVCSDYNSSNGNWIFSTITTPWVNTHPVSGNRAFGFYTDINGKMVIYTRGVDRLTDGTHRYSLVGVLAEILQENIGFAEADAKWTNFQNKVMTFITSGQASGDNGQAAVNIPVKNRPNWNKVKEVLMGTRPVSDLGCN